MQEIVSKDNSLVKKVKKLLTDKKYRTATQLFVCESKKVIDAFIGNNFVLDLLFVSKNSKYANDVRKYNKVILIYNKVYTHLSLLEHGDGMIAVFKMPKIDKKICDSKIMIFDQIQNPNNMGAIMRSAAAFNMNQLILANSSVDIYNPKVIQSSMGYGYDISIKIVTDLKQTIKELQKRGIKVYATEANAKAIRLPNVKLSKKCAVILGNEGKGIKKDIIPLCDGSIFIPMNKNVDSLNISVAASIIMCKINNEGN